MTHDTWHLENTRTHSKTLPPTQEYCQAHGLPAATRTRGIAALELRHHGRRLIDEATVLRSLHPAMRADVTWEAQRGLVQVSGLLQACRCGGG